MLKMRSCVLLALLSFALNGGGPAGCGSGRGQAGQQGNKNATATPTEMPRAGEGSVSGELKVLAEGGYAGVNDAFVAVARDAETYAALRGLTKGLPELGKDFFEHNAVVAAFLGQRPTGGYGVRIERASDGRVRVAQESPRKGYMTTQAFTYPFKVVSVPTGEEPFNSQSTLRLDLEGAWQASARPYRLTTGEFKMTGGFAPHSETFALAGDLRIMRQGNLVTILFNLKGNGEKKARSLDTVATGVVRDKAVTLASLEAGTLVDLPHGALTAKGEFGAGEERLSLSFDSLPTNISDGYQGQGKLEAAATGPAPQKNRPQSEM